MAESKEGSDWYTKGVFSFFEFSEDDKLITAINSKVKGTCRLCRTLPVHISGRRNVSSNFLKHARVSMLVAVTGNAFSDCSASTILI